MHSCVGFPRDKRQPSLLPEIITKNTESKRSNAAQKKKKNVKDLIYVKKKNSNVQHDIGFISIIILSMDYLYYSNN